MGIIVLSLKNQLTKNSDKLFGKKYPVMRRRLVLFTSYSCEMVRCRKQEDMITNRGLDGFFEHVWTVHPFASLVDSNESASRYGLPATHAFASGHTFIDGKVGRFSF